MLWPRRAALALLAAVTVPLALVGPVGQSVRAVSFVPRSSRPATATVDDRAVALDKVARRFSDYVGANLVHGTLHVYLATPAPSEISEIRSSAHGLPVSISAVRTSLKKLLAVQAAITSDINSLDNHGIYISLWGPDPITDKLVVYVKNLTPNKAARLESKYGSAYVDIVPAGPNEILTPAASREADTAPFNGGDFVINRTTMYDYLGNSVLSMCTTGPPIKSKNTNQPYLVTAGHCYFNAVGLENGWYDTQDHSIHGGKANLGTTAYNRSSYYSSDNLDVTYAAISESDLDWETTFARQQVSATTLPGGISICTSGAFEGERCGATTNGAVQNQCAQYFSDLFGVYLKDCHLYRADDPDATIVGTGDSGGPVYRLLSNGLDISGIITAEGDSYACPAGPAGPRSCSHTVYYTDMNAILGTGEYLITTPQ